MPRRRAAPVVVTAPVAPRVELRHDPWSPAEVYTVDLWNEGDIVTIVEASGPLRRRLAALDASIATLRAQRGMTLLEMRELVRLIDAAAAHRATIQILEDQAEERIPAEPEGPHDNEKVGP